MDTNVILKVRSIFFQLPYLAQLRMIIDLNNLMSCI